MYLFYNFIIILLLSIVQCTLSCTTFAVGKDATVDGSVMAAHSNDGEGTTDPRLVKVPARDYSPGALRPIYANPENYPRYVGYDRNVAAYFPENCEAGSSFGNNHCKEFIPLGYIPQVTHTFAYFEDTYGVLNENQVGIVESTCSGVFSAKSVENGGNALMSIDQLSQICMERATTARECVQIMGDLAVQYGFHGQDNSFEGGSESLYVTDPNEAFSFHILADPTGTSAIWVAARVCDSCISVTANMFSIREVDLNDTFNFLGRQDMWDIAIKQGLYKEGDVKDFTATFSDGEYAHKYYSGRRMWGVYRLIAPSAGLPSEYGNLKLDKPYPFSASVDKKVQPTDLFAVLREWYAGTNYSTGTPDENIAGGAYGSPDRYSGSTGEAQVKGTWERTIALFRTSDSYIVQSKNYAPNELGVLWFGPHVAHATTYMPLVIGMNAVPDSLSYAYQGTYNLTTNFWAVRNMQNLAQMKYSYILKDIQLLQRTYENNSLATYNSIIDKFSKVKSLTSYDLDTITQDLTNNVYKVRDAYLDLLHSTLFKYADGFNNFWASGTFFSLAVGYPAWWLTDVGYQNGPAPLNSVTPQAVKPQTLEEKHILEAKRVAQFSSIDTLNLPNEKNSQYGSYGNLRNCIDITCINIYADAMYESCITRCLNLFK